MLFIKSILGGAMIAIATKIFLMVGGGVLGALLFSIGLLVILNMEFKLFTGTVGYIRTLRSEEHTSELPVTIRSGSRMPSSA